MVCRPNDDDITAQLERELQALQDETILSDLESDKSSDSDDDAVLIDDDFDKNDSDEAFLRLKRCIEESGSLVTDSIQINNRREECEALEINNETVRESMPISEDSQKKNETLGISVPKTDIIEDSVTKAGYDLLENSFTTNKTLVDCEEIVLSQEGGGEAFPVVSASERDELIDPVDEEFEIQMRQFEEQRKLKLQNEKARLAAIKERRKQQEERESECMLMALEDYLAALCVKKEQQMREKERHLMKIEDERERYAIMQHEHELQRARRELELMITEDNASRLQRDMIAAEIVTELLQMKAEDEASIQYAKWIAAEMQRELQTMQIEDHASKARIRNEQKEQRLRKLPRAEAALPAKRELVLQTKKAIQIQDDFATQCEGWIRKLHPLPSVSKGQNVRVLTVPGQALSNISCIARLRHLERLDVSGNPLTSLNAVWLSPRLMTLSASSCGLSSIVGVINCPVIQSIDLSRNRLLTLTIEAAPFLHTLMLENNPMLNAPVLRWAPKLPDHSSLLNIGGWRGRAWQKRLQTNPKSLQEAVYLLSKPIAYHWRRNPAECIRDWWRKYSKRRKTRMATKIQRQWRRYCRRRQASLIIQRWWRSLTIRNRIRQVRRRWVDADDDIERLNVDFFDFIRGDLPELKETFINASEVPLDADEHEEICHDKQIGGNCSTLADPSAEQPQTHRKIEEFTDIPTISKDVGDHVKHDRNDASEYRTRFVMPLKLPFSTYETGLQQTNSECSLATERSLSLVSTTEQQEHQKDNETGWNFINEATRRAFERKAKRMRKLKAEKARREASPMQRVQYLRKSLRQNRVKGAPDGTLSRYTLPIQPSQYES